MEILRRPSLFLYSFMFFVVVVVILIIWPKKYNFATEEPFIVVSSYSAGPDDYRNMYDENIAINDEGHLVLFSTGNNDLIMGDDAPTLEIQLSDEQVDQVKNTIKKEKFLSIPKDVSTPSEDGGFIDVTVNLVNKTKKVKGLNPDHERFLAVFQSAWKPIENEDYQRWIEEIEEHIWERNSLRSSKKTDFSVDEPFFILTLGSKYTEELSFVYDHTITIDMDGNLVLYAPLKMEVILG